MAAEPVNPWQPTVGWQLVTLGIKVPKAYLCVCCLTSDGTGMSRQGLTYCLPCWEQRQVGATCRHDDEPGLIWRQQAG